MDIYSFPIDNFFIEDFSWAYRLDHDRNGGGIMLYFREDIPSILLTTEEKYYQEGFYVELNLRNDKWLIN